MADLINGTDNLGEAFVKANQAINEIPESISFNEGTLTITQIGGGTMTVDIPVSGDYSLTSVDGYINQYPSSGSYNVFEISATSYIVGGVSYSNNPNVGILDTNVTAYPRFDTIVLDGNSHAIFSKTGTAASVPLVEDPASTEILLAIVKVFPGANGTTKDKYKLFYSAFPEQNAKLHAEGASSVSVLDNLTDVTITSPANSQGLIYNSASGQWVNSTLNYVDRDAQKNMKLNVTGSVITSAVIGSGFATEFVPTVNNILGKVSSSNILGSSNNIINNVGTNPITLTNGSIINNVGSGSISNSSNLAILGASGLNVSGVTNVLYAPFNGMAIDTSNTTYLNNLRTNGGLQFTNIIDVQYDYTAINSDATIIALNNEQPITITLPANPTNGQIFFIKAAYQSEFSVTVNTDFTYPFEDDNYSIVLNSAGNHSRLCGGVIVQFSNALSKWIRLAEYTGQFVDEVYWNEIAGTLTDNTQLTDYIAEQVLGVASTSGDLYFNGNRTVTRSGLPAVNPGGTSVTEFLNNYFYPAVNHSVSISATNNPREFGSTAGVTLNWSVTKQTYGVTSITVNGGTNSVSSTIDGDGDAAGTTQTGTTSGVSVQNVDTSFSISAVANAVTITGATTLSWRHKRFWFKSATDYTLSSAATISTMLNGLSGSSYEFATNRDQASRSFVCSTEYAYFAYLTSYGGATFSVNGLPNTDFTYTDFSYTNSQGYVATFRIYRTGNLLTGTFAIDIN